jgi:hypothetical protein
MALKGLLCHSLLSRPGEMLGHASACCERHPDTAPERLVRGGLHSDQHISGRARPCYHNDMLTGDQSIIAGIVVELRSAGKILLPQLLLGSHLLDTISGDSQQIGTDKASSHCCWPYWYAWQPGTEPLAGRRECLHPGQHLREKIWRCLRMTRQLPQGFYEVLDGRFLLCKFLRWGITSRRCCRVRVNRRRTLATELPRMCAISMKGSPVS